jgi:type VI secretion system protein ImpH
MAASRRQPDSPLEQALFEEAPWFDFFQAVRLLRRLYRRRAREGRAGVPTGEVVRFKTRPTLAFLPAPVLALEPPAETGGPAEMTVAALTLTGVRGPLPTHYTELLIERARERDHTLAAFLDLFHHRFLAHFYRAWERCRPALELERAWDEQSHATPSARHAPDPSSARIFALMGLGMAPLRGRHDFPDAALSYYVGLFAQQHRSAVALEALLREFFALPVAVVQFVEQVLNLDPADRSTLGTSGRNNGLGFDLIAGDQITDVAGKFRLRIGPLSLAQFRSLSPDGAAFRQLVQMTRLFVGSGLVFDVQLVLRAEEIPPCELALAPGVGPRLGRDAWMKSQESAKDAEEAVFGSAFLIPPGVGTLAIDGRPFEAP